MDTQPLIADLVAQRFSLTDIAAQLGCSVPTISRALAGKQRINSYGLVVRLIELHKRHCPPREVADASAGGV